MFGRNLLKNSGGVRKIASDPRIEIRGSTYMVVSVTDANGRAEKIPDKPVRHHAELMIMVCFPIGV